MSTLELRRKVKKTVDSLPPEKLQKLAEYAGLLSARSEELSPEDKRKIANMKRWIRQADRDLAAGRTVNWRDVRRDV